MTREAPVTNLLLSVLSNFFTRSFIRSDENTIYIITTKNTIRANVEIFATLEGDVAPVTIPGDSDSVVPGSVLIASLDGDGEEGKRLLGDGDGELELTSLPFVDAYVHVMASSSPSFSQIGPKMESPNT